MSESITSTPLRDWVVASDEAKQAVGEKVSEDATKKQVAFLKGHQPDKKKWTTDQWLNFQREVFDELITLTKQKNADYTAGVGDPFANFRMTEDFGVPALTGLVIRMGDKFKRIQSYIVQGKLEVANEGIEDAFKDLIGYSALALGILKEGQGHERN